jgi:hypothetical protein
MFVVTWRASYRSLVHQGAYLKVKSPSLQQRDENKKFVVDGGKPESLVLPPGFNCGLCSSTWPIIVVDGCLNLTQIG